MPMLLKVLTDRTLDVERLELERDAAVKDEAEATQQDHDLAAELTDTEAKIKHWREVAKYNADGYCTEAKRADGWRWSAWVCGGLAVAGWVTALWLVLPV